MSHEDPSDSNTPPREPDELDRHPDPGKMPSDPGVQAERQEEGVRGEWEHE